MKVQNYLNDGANYQARAVLAFLSVLDVEEVEVARWENCREQGYILSLRSKDYSRQLNIIFFEHRNSDSICAVKWEQLSMNSITITTAKFGEVYQDKWQTSFSVSCGEVDEMANWIENEFNNFQEETK